MIEFFRPLVGRTYNPRCRQASDCRCSFLHKFFLFSLWLVASSVFAAPDIVTLQRLDFGVLAIRSNTTPSALTLSPIGTTTYDNSFVVISTPAPGRYRLTGYPAFTDISISMAASPVIYTNGLPGETLTVSAAITRPLTVRTDINGRVEFDLGASLTTSGNISPYQDGVYAGQAGLTLNFDVAGAPQFTNHAIDVDLVLRTTLTLTEMEQLAFGKLVAFSSATDQASMKLEPNGQITLTNAGNAKIVRFGNESLAMFKVTSGAAYTPVTITLPASTVYLTHHSQSTDVARFEVIDFVSLPTSANAKLDANGALEFRVGATLKTELTPKRYQDGVYTGSYLIDVTY